MKKRLFVAIQIPKSIRATLAKQCKVLSREDFTCIPPENYHITIFFLGYVDDTYQKDIIEAVTSASHRIQRFTLQYEQIIFAPPGRPTTMIWARFAENKLFKDAVIRIEKAVSVFTPKTRNYKDPIPHITLARYKGKTMPEKQELAGTNLPDLQVQSLTLYESQLGSDGAIYKEIISLPLRGTQALKEHAKQQSL